MPIEIQKSLRRMDESHFKECDYQVMGAAFDIHNALGNLFSERTYQQELADPSKKMTAWYRSKTAGFSSEPTIHCRARGKARMSSCVKGIFDQLQTGKKPIKGTVKQMLGCWDLGSNLFTTDLEESIRKQPVVGNLT